MISSELLPINTVIAGPRLDASLAGEASQFFRANGYPDVAVRASSLASVWR